MVESAPSSLSLNTILPELSGALELTPGKIYERQRQLVKAGLLISKKGMGPGSGVQATPHNVAMVLTTILAVQRGDAVKRTKLLAAAKPLVSPCPYTGKTSFLGVLANILSGPAAFAPGSVRWWPKQIIVAHDTLEATVQWPLDQFANQTWDAEFTISGKASPALTLGTNATLNGSFFPRLVEALNRAGHALTGAR